MRFVVDATTFFTVHFTRGLPPQSLAQMTRQFAVCAVHQGDCTGAGPCQCACWFGISRCSDKDQFSGTGRKIAFTRAIQSLPQEVRAIMWQQFLLKWPPPNSITKRGKHAQSGASGETRNVGRVQKSSAA